MAFRKTGDASYLGRVSVTATRGDPTKTLTAEDLERIAREHGLPVTSTLEELQKKLSVDPALSEPESKT
jgi:hypothetical protein